MRETLKKMRKTGTLLLILFCILCLADSGEVRAASARTTYKKAITYYKKKQYAKAIKAFRKLPENISDAKAGKLTSKMKKAYRKIVKSYSTDIFNRNGYLWGYYLTDINKDGRAELMVKYGTCEADVRLRIYTYKGGKAKRLKTLYCGHSSFYAYPIGNGVLMHQGQMGAERMTLITLSGGKIKTRLLGKRQIKDDYVTPAYYLSDHITYSNGSKVSYKPLT